MKKQVQQIRKLLMTFAYSILLLAAKATPLSGVYTIDASQATGGMNFQTFKSAVDTLKKYGVSDAVTFNIASGTYTEQITIPAITGASAANTITFQSAVKHVDSVVLQFNAGISVNIITLNNASYINFKYITVQSLHAAGGRCFQLSGTASYDSIVYCNLRTSQTGINADQLSGGKNVFSNNNIKGNAPIGNNYSITRGIVVYGTDAVRTDSNVIANNKIESNLYGLEIYYNTGTLIVNNSLYSSDGSGIYSFYNTDQRVYHNTIWSRGWSVVEENANITTANNQWKNNIITVWNPAQTIAVQIGGGTGGNTVWDYNIYYAASGSLTLISHAGDFAGWQSIGQDSHSVVLNPGFIKREDLRLTSNCEKQGTPLADVTTDIDGNPRNNPPTIGAFEYAYTNNLAIDAWIEPVDSNFTPGLQNLTVRIKNNGINSVSSFWINYKLNNDAPFSQLWNAGILAPCDTVWVTFTGVNLQNENKLTVYTSDPNFGYPEFGNDTYPEDDSITKFLYTPLSGTYTIGSSLGASFASFNDAVSVLVSGGISGAVVFNVESGNYAEANSVVIPLIQGVSDSNTITFQSAAGHADSVTLWYNNPRYDVREATVKLENASYITFKNITVSAIRWESITLTDHASYNSILNCNITNSIFGWYLTGGYNTFSSNIVTGSSGLHLRGLHSGVRFRHNIITGNTIQVDNIGIALGFSSDNIVANNSISVTGENQGVGAGITSDYATNDRFYNNTIVSAIRAVDIDYEPSNSGNEWKNNIIISTGTANNHFAVNVGDYDPNNIWDYNIYYTNGTNVFEADFAAWRVGRDSHSVIMKPDFVSDSNLHLASGCKFGTPLAAVTTDIEGNVRNNPPTIGAYEYLDIDNIAVDALPDALITTGSQDLVVRIKNTGVNTITSFTVNYQLDSGTSVPYPWTGSLAPCDTVSVTIPGVNLQSETQLTVYTTQPNGNTDTHNGNDTLIKILYVKLGGVYTIDTSKAPSATNFQSFGTAVHALIKGGVRDSVVFNVATGTYSELITIPAIAGTSATNTITFQSAANHPDSVILEYNFAMFDFIFMVTLDNASYINFKYITLKAADTTMPGGILFALTGSPSFNSIMHCNIKGGVSGICGIPLSGGGYNTFGYNTISNALFLGGIYLQGSSTGNLIIGNTLLNNSTGLTLLQGGYNTLVVNNRINSNILSGGIGIQSTNGNGQRFYHNNISVNDGQGIVVQYGANDTGNVWKNNIIAEQGTGNAAKITNAPGLKNTWDYNLYYTNGPHLFSNSPTQFELWQMGGQDKHSIVYRPAFTSTTDLTPNPVDTASWAINGRAEFIDSSLAAILSIDVNGNPRPLKREDGLPDIGAYQFTPTALAPLAITTDTLAADSTQTFFSPITNDTVAQIKWRQSSLVPFNVEVREYVGEQPLGTSTTDKFMYYYVDIKDSGYGGYFYDIAVYYQDAWLGKIDTEQDIRLQKRTVVDPWMFNAAGSNYSQVDTARNIITDQYLQAFGSFTGAELNNPLPVQLLSLKATAVKDDVLLTWSTASEVNSSYFEVERLVNENQWSVISKVGAKGNSTSINNYQFTDQSPFTPEASGHQSLYYRLRIANNDGSYEYSKVVSVSREQQATQSLTVYPNPFSNNVNLEFVSTIDGTANINIIDITGRDVQLNVSQQIIKGNNLLSIDTDKLNKGIYFLSVELNGKKQVVKLVKQ